MRRVIIDGYNLLRSVRRYAAEVERDIDSARERLIADLGARVAEGQDVTVVFDGGGNPSSRGDAARVGGVAVIFSAAGTSADSVIESLAARARDEGLDTEIVTTDADTRWASVGGPVIVTRSSTFARELELDEVERREWHDAPRARHVVGDRLDAETRARLDRMAGRGPRPSA